MPTVINGTTGLTFSDGSVQNTAAINFRNHIINGTMAIAQRGTSVAINGTTPTYFVDRFAGVYSTTVTGTLSQQSTGGLAGFPNCARAQRTSGQTATGNLSVIQILESANSVDLAGNSVTLSFWARAGSNFSASGNALTAAVYTGTGTDQSAASFMAGSWTGLTAIINSGITLSTSWQRFTLTGTAASSANQFGLIFQASLTGTAGANDFFEVTGVQLEEGTTASSFDYRSIGQELALCQRYYLKLGPGNSVLTYDNYNSTSSSCAVYITYPVPMRATPTGSYSAIGDFGFSNTNSGNFVVTGRTTTTAFVGTDASATGRCQWYTNNANAFFAFSAEL